MAQSLVKPSVSKSKAIKVAVKYSLSYVRVSTEDQLDGSGIPRQEKEYQSVYKPEEQGLDDRRIGPYSMSVQRLNTGGLAQIKKFNSGGINYLPSKISHDENDSK
mgnify:CR=1 FL=1